MLRCNRKVYFKCPTASGRVAYGLCKLLQRNYLFTWLISEERRGELIAELKCLPGGRCRLLTGSSSLPAKAQQELKTDWRMQRMGIGNVVLNRRKNCSREAATPVSEEPAFRERDRSARQKLLGSADK